MNIKLIFTLSIFSCLFFPSLVFTQDSVRPVFSQDNIDSPDDIERKKSIALEGSPDVALDLMWIYFDHDDQEIPIFWARIAMENGSIAGKHAYASLLYKRGDEVSLTRAAYHLRHLSKQGDKDAATLLEEVERKRKRLFRIQQKF